MPLGGESIVNLIDYRSMGADGLKPYTTVLEYRLGRPHRAPATCSNLTIRHDSCIEEMHG
jgi:hypothetical protein